MGFVAKELIYFMWKYELVTVINGVARTVFKNDFVFMVSHKNAVCLWLLNNELNSSNRIKSFTFFKYIW